MFETIKTAAQYAAEDLAKAKVLNAMNEAYRIGTERLILTVATGDTTPYEPPAKPKRGA